MLNDSLQGRPTATLLAEKWPEVCQDPALWASEFLCMQDEQCLTMLPCIMQQNCAEAQLQVWGLLAYLGQ